jgi:transketolase
VALILEAQERLEGEGIKTRAVSMPSWELFERQPDDYRDSVLPDDVDCRLAVEAGSPQGWQRWTGARGDIIGVETFGSSAPANRVMDELGFNVDNVCRKARRILDRKVRTG